MPSILIRSQENGEIDYDDLADALHMHRERPAIIVANIGTTMTEAKDDIGKIKQVFKKSAIRNYYIHCDAALAGIYLSLLELGNNFDFSAGADSIAISGHKFIGSPIPCGVVMVKKNYKDRIGKAIPYIGTIDTTITGSRNGHSPLFLWYAIKTLGKEGLKKRALESLKLAEYTTSKLKEIGVLGWRNENSITVVFPKPSNETCIKWQIASEGNFAHIICMPGVTRDQIDECLVDIKIDNAK